MAANEQALKTLTMVTKSDVDLSAKQYYAVTLASNTNGVDVATAAKACDGILQNKPTAGQAASVGIDGVSVVAITASSAVLQGSLLEVDTGGTLKLLASGTAVAVAQLATGAPASICFIPARLLPGSAVRV